MKSCTAPTTRRHGGIGATADPVVARAREERDPGAALSNKGELPTNTAELTVIDFLNMLEPTPQPRGVVGKAGSLCHLDRPVKVEAGILVALFNAMGPNVIDGGISSLGPAFELAERVAIGHPCHLPLE